MPLPWQGIMNGHFMNLKLTSLEEFMSATSALAPVYAAFAGVILVLLLVLKLLGPTQAGQNRAEKGVKAM